MTTLPEVAQGAFQDGYREAYAKELFGAFRNAFAAEYLPRWVVFWVEEKRGCVIVRQVKNLARRRKSEDGVVGTTVNDSAAIRILIGNFAASCKLSTVRWELYRDFALTEKVESGRFDYNDLVGEVPREKRKMLLEEGIFPRGDWDFDGLLLTHLCPLCRGVFNRTSILYLSRTPCESCGKEIPQNISRDIICKLINATEVRSRKITEQLSTHNRKFDVQNFLDPVANSVALWPVAHLEHNLSVENIRSHFSSCFSGFTKLYNQSVFGLISCGYLERTLIQFARRACNGSGDITVKTLKRIGERFSPLWAKQVQQNPDLLLTEGLDLEITNKTLPRLVNELILNYRKLTKPERKQDT